jgi:plastocyanin
VTPDVPQANGTRPGLGSSTVLRVVVAVAVVLAAALVVLRLHNRGPGTPVHLAGKVDNHGTRTVRDGSTIKVLLEDTSFSPTFMYVTAGSHFSIALHDQGFHAHTFTVPSLGIDVTLAPNASMTIPVDVPSSGTVPFECRFHKSNGMQGAFVIKSA